MYAYGIKKGTLVALAFCLVLFAGSLSLACDYNKCIFTEFGSISENTITRDLEQHGYFLEIASGEAAVVRINHFGASFDPGLELLAPDGAVITSAGTPGTYRTEIISGRISSAGNYSVIVSDITGMGAGEYRMSIQSAISPIDAQFIYYDDIIRDQLTEYTRYIPYQFDAAAGEVVTVQMISINKDFQPFIRLFSPYGNSVGAAGDNEYAVISYRVVPDSGTYTIMAGDIEGDDLGEYYLILLRQPLDTDDETPFGVPMTYSLQQNYPNPFNPETVIDFALPKSGYVEVTVHNVLGETVRKLAGATMPAGNHSVTWDGRDESGQPVASGIYLYRLTAGEFVESKKMVLVK